MAEQFVTEKDLQDPTKFAELQKSFKFGTNARGSDLFTKYQDLQSNLSKMQGLTFEGDKTLRDGQVISYDPNYQKTHRENIDTIQKQSLPTLQKNLLDAINSQLQYTTRIQNKADEALYNQNMAVGEEAQTRSQELIGGMPAFLQERLGARQQQLGQGQISGEQALQKAATTPTGSPVSVSEPQSQVQAAIQTAQQKYDTNMGATGADVNSIYQEALGREATAEEQAYYQGKKIGDVLNDLQNTTVAQDPSQTPSGLPQEYQLIKNKAELEVLTGQGLTEDNIFRDPLSSRMYYNPDFNVPVSDSFGADEINLASLSKKSGLSEETVSSLDFSGKSNALLDEIRDRLFSDVGFNTKLQAELEAKYGIEGIDSEIASIDKQIATLTQSLNLGMNAIQAAPISLNQIRGQQAQMMRTVGAELEGMASVKQALLGEQAMAETRMNRALEAARADKEYEHGLLADWYNEVKSDLDKEDQRKWEMFLQDRETEIEDERLRKEQVGNIMLDLASNGYSSDISLSDDFDTALDKAAPIYADMRIKELMASGDVKPQNFGTSDNPYWGIYDPETNSIVPVNGGLAMTSINGNLPNPNAVISFDDAKKWGVAPGTTYNEMISQQQQDAVDVLGKKLGNLENILNNNYWTQVVGAGLGNKPMTFLGMGIGAGEIADVQNQIKQLISTDTLDNLINIKFSCMFKCSR